MRAHIRKWGNSLAVRIPRAFAAEANFADGAPVELSVADGKLIVAPLRAPRASLRRLVARIRPGLIHGESDWGDAAGKETW